MSIRDYPRLAALGRWLSDIGGGDPGECTARADGAVVHVTRWLHDDEGRPVGRLCRCRRVVLTVAGNPSPRPLPDRDPSKAHLARVAAS